METSISAQLLALLSFGLLGLLLGLVYDLLRPLRYFCKGGTVWDFFFCALGAAGFFCLSMQSGRPEFWGMAAALGCFCLYINLLSPLLLPVFLGIFNIMHKGHISLSLRFKKLLFSVKKFFTNVPD